MPARLSGHPALDFCNTFTGWDEHTPWDYLEGYDHLAVWAGYVGLLAPARVASLRHQARRRPDAAAGVLEHARQLRASLYDVLADASDAEPLEYVADAVHAAGTRLRLVRPDQTIQWEIEPEAGLASPVLAAAWSAGGLLTSPSLARLRTCPGRGCGWLFLDVSGRRRWCTMATCGNREKAKRFTAKRRQDPAGGDTDSEGGGGQAHSRRP